MRLLIQRVSKAAVRVDGRIVGQIGPGLVIFVGATHSDTNAQVKLLADKVTGLRIFSDANDKMNLSLLDVSGGALVISQFTLYANARRGRRPDFIAAARPEYAAPLVEQFARRLEENGAANIQTGVFGANMQVEIHNDGPVTVWLDSAELTTDK